MVTKQFTVTVNAAANGYVQSKTTSSHVMGDAKTVQDQVVE